MIPKTPLTVDCSRQGWEEYIHIQSAPKKKGQTAEFAKVHLTLSSYLSKCGPEPVASAGPVGNADRERDHSRPQTVILMHKPVREVLI